MGKFFNKNDRLARADSHGINWSSDSAPGYTRLIAPLRNRVMPDKEPSSSMSHQQKKKRVEDIPLSPDAGTKPIQLQRRRVWRACESCRYVPFNSSD